MGGSEERNTRHWPTDHAGGVRGTAPISNAPNTRCAARQHELGRRVVSAGTRQVRLVLPGEAAGACCERALSLRCRGLGTRPNAGGHADSHNKTLCAHSCFAEAANVLDVPVLAARNESRTDEYERELEVGGRLRALAVDGPETRCGWHGPGKASRLGRPLSSAASARWSPRCRTANEDRCSGHPSWPK